MDQERPRLSTPEGRARDPAADDPSPPPSPRRFARLLPPPTVRRLSPQGIGLVAVALAGLLGLAGWLGMLALDGATHWLHAQPGYQIEFGAITLDPPPPAWYRGGAPAFLDRVRTGARHPRYFSVLDLDLDRLRKAFLLDPWVHGVGQVRKVAPNRVVVPLEYREPVALAVFGDAEGPAVDAEGVLLPPDEVDRSAAAPLIALYNFPRPVAPRLGVRWSTEGPQAGGPEPDPRVAAAARVADFLRGKVRGELAQGAAFPRVYLHGEGGFTLAQVGHDFFLWGEVEERPDPDAPTDDEKWAMLRDRVRRQPAPPRGGYTYLRFTRSGLREYDRRPAPGNGRRGASR